MPVGAAVAGLLGGLFAPPICWSCSGLARRGEPLCGRCRASLHRLTAEPVFLSGVRVWAPVAYAGTARDLVRALKFRGAIGVADAMAAQIVANAPAALLDASPAAALLDASPAAALLDASPAAALLDAAPAASRARLTAVPVPLHPRRLRSRGYNQAAVIAEAVARRADLEIADCLVRSGPSVTQMGRDRAQRKAGPVGSIEVRPPVRGAPGIAPERVLLIDDVVTTGATLGACRDALVAADARDVAAVAFARTIGR
jgi:predicted amidophosphoribosyltransferase